VAHAYPIVTRMAESRPEEAVVASRYNFQVVTTGQGFVPVSRHPSCMVRGLLKCGCEAGGGRLSDMSLNSVKTVLVAYCSSITSRICRLY